MQAQITQLKAQMDTKKAEPPKVVPAAAPAEADHDKLPSLVLSIKDRPPVKRQPRRVMSSGKL
jgi:hypothetical protein